MKSIHYGILGITTMLATLSPQMAEALEKIGVVGLAGTTVIATSEDGAKRTLKTGDAVYLNDHVVSDAGGNAQLIFLDHSTLTLKANTDLTVDTYVYDPAAANGTMAVSSVKGAFRFVGGALSKKQPVTIKTPVATIGIRGGIADTNVQPGGATDAVFVYGEQLSMTNQNGETSTTNQIGTGLMLDNPVGTPAPMPPEMVNQRMQAFGGAPAAGNGNGGGNGSNGGGQSNNSGGNGNSNGSGNSGGTNAGSANADNSSNSGGGFGGNAGDLTVQLLGENGAPVGAPITFVENIGNLIGNVAQDVGTTPESAIEEEPESASDGEEASGDSSDDDGEEEVVNGEQPIAGDDQPPVDADSGDTLAESDPLAGGGSGGSSGGGAVIRDVKRWGYYEYRDSMVGSNNGSYDVIVGPDQANSTYEQINHEDDLLGAATGTPLVNGNGAMLAGMVDKFTPGLTSGVTLDVTPIKSDATQANRTSLATQTLTGQAYTSPFGGMTYLQLYNLAGGQEKQLTAVYGDWIQHSLQPDFTTALVDARNRSAQASDMAGFGGVSFYNFLPKMAALHQYTDSFGFFDYNIADTGLLSTAFVGAAGNEVRNNAPGLAVDWLNGVALGMDVEFVATGDSKPSATVAMGRVDNSGGGTGEYIKGNIQKFFGQQLNSGGISSITKSGEFRVGDEMFGRPDKPIEGMFIDYGYALSAAPCVLNSCGNKGQQAVVLDNTPAATPAEMGGETGGTHTGFAGGLVKYGPGTYVVPYASTNLSDVSLNMDPSNRTVEGSITLNKQNAAAVPATFSGTFGSTSDTSKSAYISDNIYAAEQTGGTIDSRNAGFIVSGKAANVSVECTNCQYTQWGVWAAGGTATTASSVPTSAEMIPYVVGSEVTQNFDSTKAGQIAAQISGGTATYDGAAYGNFVKNGAYIQNAVGTMNADVNLTTREVTSLNMDFGIVHSSPLTIATTTNSTVINDVGDATFNNPNVQVNWNGVGGAGTIHGALFGPNAEEIGGNFAIEKTATDTLTGGGVFQGTRLP